MTQYRAWLVDLDGTLYHPLLLKGLMALQLGLFGLRQVGVLRRFRKEHELLREQLHEEVESPYALQLERAASSLGVAPEQVRRVTAEWMVERPSRLLHLVRRRALLAELAEYQASGGLLALVSDYPARRKLRGLRAEGLFQVVVANGEPGGPGRLKPYPDGYLKAAAELGVPNEACLVLGDRDDADGAAARAAGMGFRLIGS